MCSHCVQVVMNQEYWTWAYQHFLVEEKQIIAGNTHLLSHHTLSSTISYTSCLAALKPINACSVRLGGKMPTAKRSKYRPVLPCFLILPFLRTVLGNLQATLDDQPKSETGSAQQYRTAQRGMAQHSTAQHSTAQHSTAQHSTLCPSIVIYLAHLHT